MLTLALNSPRWPLADRREVWVTARGSDDLLCFSAAALRSDPAPYLPSRQQTTHWPSIRTALLCSVYLKDASPADLKRIG